MLTRLDFFKKFASLGVGATTLALMPWEWPKAEAAVWGDTANDAVVIESLDKWKVSYRIRHMDCSVEPWFRVERAGDFMGITVWCAEYPACLHQHINDYRLYEAGGILAIGDIVCIGVDGKVYKVQQESRDE